MGVSDPHGDRKPDQAYGSVITYNQLEEITDAALGDLKNDYSIIGPEVPKDSEDYDRPLTRGEDDLVVAATVELPTGNSPSVDSSLMDVSNFAAAMPPEGYTWTHVWAEEYGENQIATTFYTFGQNDRDEEAVSDRFGRVDVNELLSERESSDQEEIDAGVGEFYSPEGFGWDDFGADEALKSELMQKIQLPLEHGDVYDSMGIEPDGILLYGPPGTGKTMIGRIAASEAESNFLHATGADIYGSLMGESEQNVQELFEVARENSPTLVFIDEIDQISQERGSSSNGSTDRVVNQMLTELDGMEDNKGVRVVGTTNRVDQVDPALRRKGRLSEEIEVPAPNYEGRKKILQIHTDTEFGGSGVPVADDLDYAELAEKTKGYTGADIAELVQTAAEENVREIHREEGEISLEDHSESLLVDMQDLEDTLDILDK